MYIITCVLLNIKKNPLNSLCTLSMGMPTRACLYLFTDKTWMLPMNECYFDQGKLCLGQVKYMDFLEILCDVIMACQNKPECSAPEVPPLEWCPSKKAASG